MSRNHDRPRQVKYVYDLPYTEREKLCKILDINNCWEKLGGKYMDFTVTDLNAIRLVEKCGESPTNRLLQLWGQENHTLMQLFDCLWKMEHFQALRALQPCIDEKYHTLFLNDERNITESIRAKPPSGGIIVKNSGLVHPNPYGTPPHLSYRMDVPHNMPNQYSTPPHPKPNTTVNHGIVINQHTVSTVSPFSKAMHPTPGNSHLQDGRASLEGAYALSPTHIPVSHHGAHNFNQGPPYPPSYTTSPKVPAALLYSSQSVVTTQQGVTVADGMQHSVSGAAGVMTGTVGMKQGIAGTGGMKYSVAGGMDQNMTGTGGMKHSMTGLGGMNQTVGETGGMKQGMAEPGDLRASVTGIGEMRHTVSSSQYPQPTSPLVQEPSHKINNYEDIGGNGVVSCEDNTGAGYNTTEKDCYDPSQDYMNRLKEKEAKEAARQAEEAGLNHNTNPVSLTLTQDSASNNFRHPSPASPLTPSPQPTSDMYPKNAAAAAPSRKVSSSSCSSSTDGGPGGCSSSVPVIPYKELEEATTSWNQHNLLGRGGFGAVFKGIWKNTEVAVKRIEPHGNASRADTRLHISQSLEELKLLQSYRHDNILQVYGYSMDHEQYPCLVYQFMPNGSVEDRLQGRKIEALGVSGVSGWSSSCGSWSQQGLTWKQRYRVAWGTAKALQFLHTVKDKPLIHGDVKSANILLDQNYEPKLGDFGLAREGKSQSTSIKVSRVHGTKPYLPDDYLRHKKLSVKVDTYSYGVVLFELCTGLRAYDEKRKGGTKLLRDLVEETAEAETLRDSTLVGRPDDGIFHFLYELGKKCVHTLSTKRPDMKAVFEELGKFAQLLEERAQARRISQGDSSSGCSTPHHLQVCFDTAGSIHGHSPTPSPSLQPPSFPNFHPSSLSAISPLPPSPVSPAHSPAPPSHFPHPAPHFTPQYLGRPTLQFCPHPTSHYPPGAVLRQGGQISPGAHYPPRFMPHLQVSLAGHDPPTYSETMSQGPGVVAGMMAGAGAVVRPGMMPRMRLPAVGSALVPDFATLNMNDTSYSSESSNYVDSDSSLAASTTHNIGVRQDPPLSPPGNMMPLLTALGTKDDDASIVLPTAASKTFTLK
ncbi:hypothetical protein Pmani_008406 [Petrolisthes manimaculis]|uniref:non-specific serine/threonine protein kinase n=1 Tax=Petrolisthes manimaculis TaxID=1843537 RepID=A0AAE1UJM5_9EUCA|nr:hypothetical protein Pmani_008406 [Petrolisthes manimaculis]